MRCTDTSTYMYICQSHNIDTCCIRMHMTIYINLCLDYSEPVAVKESSARMCNGITWTRYQHSRIGSSILCNVT